MTTINRRQHSPAVERFDRGEGVLEVLTAGGVQVNVIKLEPRYT